MGLSASQTELVLSCAALAARDEEGFSNALHRAYARCSHVEVEEALVQSYLFLGYPISLNGLKVWREVQAEHREPGESIELPFREAPDGAREGEDPEDAWEGWRQRGEKVCGSVYAGQYDRLRSNIRALHPDMEVWMVVEGYGKVIGRPGMSLVNRELCIVAILAVLGTLPQLYSHLRGAIQVGAPEAQVDETLSVILPWVPVAQHVDVSDCWEKVRSRILSS